MLTAALLGYGGLARVVSLVLFTLLLLVFAVTALSLGLAFALPVTLKLIAVIFVPIFLCCLQAPLAPLSFMPVWMGWLAALNPLTFAIEPFERPMQALSIFRWFSWMHPMGQSQDRPACWS